MLSSGPDSVVFRGKRYYFQVGYEYTAVRSGDYGPNGSVEAAKMLKRFREKYPRVPSIASHHFSQTGQHWWGVYARREK